MSLGCVLGPQALILLVTPILISITQSLLPLNNSLNKVKLICASRGYQDVKVESAFEERKLLSKTKISCHGCMQSFKCKNILSARISPNFFSMRVKRSIKSGKTFPTIVNHLLCIANPRKAVSLLPSFHYLRSKLVRRSHQ